MKKSKKRESNFLSKALEWFGMGFCLVLILILAVAFFPVTIIYLIITSTRHQYRFLEKKGFSYKNSKQYGYVWVYKNVCINYMYDYRFQDIVFRISSNYDEEKPAFIDIYKSDIGTENERDALKTSIDYYRNASSLVLQKDQPEKEVELLHKQFLEKFLDNIISRAKEE